MYNSPKTKLTGVFNSAVKGAKKVKAAVVDATSDVISAPARIGAAMVSDQATKDVKTLRRARAYDNAPSFNEDGTPTDAMMARSSADEVRMRRAPKKK